MDPPQECNGQEQRRENQCQFLQDPRLTAWMYGSNQSQRLLWVTGAGGSGKSRLVSIISTAVDTKFPNKICGVNIPRSPEAKSLRTPGQVLRFLAFELALRNTKVLDGLLSLARSGFVLEELSSLSIWQLMDEVFRIEQDLYVIFNGFDRFETSARTEFLHLLSNFSVRYPSIRILISGRFDVATDRHLRARSALIINLDEEVSYAHAIARQMASDTLGLDPVSELFEIFDRVATHLDQRLFHVRLLILALQLPLETQTEVSKRELLMRLQSLSIPDLYEKIENHLIARVDALTKEAFLTFKNLTFHHEILTTVAPRHASIYVVPMKITQHRSLKEFPCCLPWETMLHDSHGPIAKHLYSLLHTMRKHDVLQFPMSGQSAARTVWRFCRPVKSSWLIFSRQTEAVGHWGVIVSDLNRTELQRLLCPTSRKSNYQTRIARVGELHELQRDGTMVRHNFRTCTLDELVGSQKVAASLHYIGETSWSDEEIIDQGTHF